MSDTLKALGSALRKAQGGTDLDGQTIDIGGEAIKIREEHDRLRAEVERLRALAGRYVAWVVECERITHLFRHDAPFSEGEIVELDEYCAAAIRALKEQQGE